MMRRQSRILYGVFIIVFTLNATLSNAACCIALDAGSPVVVEHTTATTPCHGSADPATENKKVTQQSDKATNCCPACLVMLEACVIQVQDNPFPNSKKIALMSQYRSTDQSALFRPPIQHL